MHLSLIPYAVLALIAHNKFHAKTLDVRPQPGNIAFVTMREADFSTHIEILRESDFYL